MWGRERDTFLQLSTHLLFLIPLFLNELYFFFLFPFASPRVFLSLGAALKSFWTEVCDSLSPPASTICCFFTRQLPYHPAHPRSLFWADILTASSLFQPAALGPGGLCLLQDSVGYESKCSSSGKIRPICWLSFCFHSSASKVHSNGEHMCTSDLFSFALSSIKEIIHYWFYLQLFVEMHTGKIWERSFSALKTGNQDHFPEALKLNSDQWELRPSQVQSGAERDHRNIEWFALEETLKII